VLQLAPTTVDRNFKTARHVQMDGKAKGLIPYQVLVTRRGMGLVFDIAQQPGLARWHSRAE
jgi:hypothetical protein